MLLSWAGVPRARRGLSETAKRSFAPLCIEMVISPSRKQASCAVSANVLMPLFDDKLPMLFCKTLCSG